MYSSQRRNARPVITGSSAGDNFTQHHEMKKRSLLFVNKKLRFFH